MYARALDFSRFFCTFRSTFSTRASVKVSVVTVVIRLSSSHLLSDLSAKCKFHVTSKCYSYRPTNQRSKMFTLRDSGEFFFLPLIPVISERLRITRPSEVSCFWPRHPDPRLAVEPESAHPVDSFNTS